MNWSLPNCFPEHQKAFSQIWVCWENFWLINLSRMQQWRGWELRNLKSHYVKITDESSCFSLGFLSQNSLWKLSIFRGYEGYLYLCVFGIRRVRFFQNRAGWWLSLAIWLSRKFKPRTNWMASLYFLSCSAPTGMTLQLLCMLGTWATFGGLQGVSYPRDPVVSPCYFVQT